VWVIPTMLLVGLVIGRWWVIPLGGVAWAVLVVLAVSIAPGDVPLAAALGAANVALGVVLRWVVVSIARLAVWVTRLARAA
jgi:hypothetical protein